MRMNIRGGGWKVNVLPATWMSHGTEASATASAAASTSALAALSAFWLASVFAFCLPFWCYFRLLCSKPAVRQFASFFLLATVLAFCRQHWTIAAVHGCRLGGFKWRQKLLRFDGCCFLKPLPPYLTVLAHPFFAHRSLWPPSIRLSVRPLGHQSILARIKRKQDTRHKLQEARGRCCKKWKGDLLQTATPWAHLLQLFTLTCSTLIDPHSEATTRPFRSQPRLLFLLQFGQGSWAGALRKR